MPDQKNSTPFVPVATAQDQIAGIVLELHGLEARLANVVVNPRDENVVAQHVRAGTACVRTDLLADAIETLSALAGMSTESARERDAEVVVAVERLTVFC